MRVSWKTYESEGRKTEAQLWEPDAPTGNVILFCPGFPGMGATVFEQRHAAALAGAGFALIVLRHNGTRFDRPSAPLMINNGWRLKQARQKGETLLGGAPSAIADWLLEPLPVLKELSKNYAHIFVVGNSFGALSALWTLTDPGAPLEKVRHIVLLAGAQGVLEDGGLTDVMRIWKPEFIAMPRITEKVTLEDSQKAAATIRGTYRDLPERTKTLPSGIRMTYLVVAKDELLYLPDTEKFRAAIGGRGNIVIDDSCRACPELLLMAHDMPDYTTESFLELIKG